MNLDEARNVIRNESDAPIGRLWHATVSICSVENENHVSLEEIIACLKRSNQFNRVTLVDEIAVSALYARTGRERKNGHAAYEDFVTNAEDWLSYIRSSQAGSGKQR